MLNFVDCCGLNGVLADGVLYSVVKLVFICVVVRTVGANVTGFVIDLWAYQSITHSASLYQTVSASTSRLHLLQYIDAVGWVFWPVKPTTESENRLQLDSLSTSVNIDRLTMVDNMSAVGNDSRPWVVPQSIKWLSTIMRERRIRPDSESGWIPHFFGTSVSSYRQCLTGSSWQQQQQQQQVGQLQVETDRLPTILTRLLRWLLQPRHGNYGGSWKHNGITRSLLCLQPNVSTP